MIKRPFLLFITVVGTLVLGLIWFIQSAQFASAFKSIAFRYLPKNSGIVGDFSEFSVKLFPPGLSVRNPKVTLEEGNIAGLPPGSQIVAERIDFTFLPFQVFSGDIRVHEVTISDGSIRLALNPSVFKKKQPAHKTSKPGIHWDELLQVRAEAISLQNVRLNVEFTENPQQPPLGVGLVARSVKVAQWSGKGGLGYSLNLDVDQIQGDYLRKYFPTDSPNHLVAKAKMNALGFQLESFDLINSELEISSSAQVKGNLLSPKTLPLDATLRVKGDLDQIAKSFQTSIKGKIPVSGSVVVNAKIQANLEKFLETLRVESNLTLKNVSYQKWKADQVLADFKWSGNPSGTGGELFLKKASIFAREKPRVGGLQPGEGGRIEIGAVKWNLGSPAPIQVPLTLERAHVHWLGAPGLKEIYGLDFRINGSINATLTPPVGSQAWELQANLATLVDHFALDNQRYLQTKPLTTVFQVPQIGLDAVIIANGGGIRTNNLTLTLPHTKLHAIGRIDFKTGYDLAVNGNVKLDDLDKISGNAVHGQGTLNAHIHGPTSRVFVDMDLDLKNAFYLGLELGDAKGRITWDDDPQTLIFTRMHLNKVTTFYSLEGTIDVGKVDNIDLNAQISKGTIQDFVGIFGNLTKDLAWFPHELTGPVTGDLKVGGGVSFKKLKVQTHLNGINWDYWGERFKSVQFTGGYDAGRYYLNDFNAIKKNAKILGKISLDADETLDWEFHTEDFTVADLDHIVQLDVPIRGKLDFSTTGHGPPGNVDSSLDIDLSAFTVRGVPMASSDFSLRMQKGVATFEGNVMGGQGLLDGAYDFNSKQLSHIRGELKQLDFSPVLLLLNTKSIQDQSLNGRISGAMNLNFHSDAPERASGIVSFTEYLLNKSDAKFTLSHPVSIKMTDGNFTVDDLGVRGKTGEATLSLKSTNTHLEGQVSGDLDTSWIEFFTPTVAQASGTSSLDFTLGGTLRNPTLYGTAELDGGSVRLSFLDSPFENVTGIFQLRQNVFSVKKFRADLGGGSVAAEGQVEVFGDRYPKVSINGTLSGPKVKVYPFQYVKLNGVVGVHGDELPYVIDGSLNIDSALSREKMLSQKQSTGGLKVLQYVPPPTKQGESNYSKFKLNVDVQSDHGIQIQNDVLKDAQIRGKFALVNTLDAPRILGNMSVIQGKVVFKDHVFQIQSANVSFDSPTVINPSFDLNATTEINGTKIQLYATGRPDKMKIEFTANPAMEESDILSLLAIGVTSGDAKKLSASDYSVLQQGEAASLVLHSLDFNRDIEDKTGFQVILDESVNPQQGVSAFRPQAQTDTAAAPQITLRKRLGDRVTFSAGSTVGVGTNKANQVNLDYFVNSDMSITGVYNNYSTNGVADSQQTQNSLGLDLKFLKRFK